jgi:hypothetical protein
VAAIAGARRFLWELWGILLLLLLMVLPVVTARSVVVLVEKRIHSANKKDILGFGTIQSVE